MPLSYQGLDQLADAIKINSTIKKIDLSCNDMSDSFGSIIAKFIQS